MIPTLLLNKVERDRPVITNPSCCHPCHSVDMKLMGGERWPTQALLMRLDFFFFLCFHRQIDAIRNLCLPLGPSANPAHSTWELTAQTATPKLPMAPWGSETAGTPEKTSVLKSCNLRGLWSQIETSHLKNCKAFPWFSLILRLHSVQT